MQAARRVCSSCGAEVRNRRALVPRFCPDCGNRLAPGHMQGQLMPARALDAPRRADGAVSSLILGMFSLCAPPLGILLGLLAIFIGVGANNEIEKSAGALTGRGFAVSGIMLGSIGVLLSLGFCASAM